MSEACSQRKDLRVWWSKGWTNLQYALAMHLCQAVELTPIVVAMIKSCSGHSDAMNRVGCCYRDQRFMALSHRSSLRDDG